ncbi:MAG: hypothetical protein GKR87_08915 [Kiritimatiellae bacterium]|nr:hypothetical protein [Kiritimatiellia bacterium]
MVHIAKRYTARVLENKQLSSTGYALILERGNMSFQAGRLITLHGEDITQDRSYTIASGEQDRYIEVLYRLIPTGQLTPKLVHLKAGDAIDFSGPYGAFVLRNTQCSLVFIATGTGMAPCRSYIRTYPHLSLTLIHGVSQAEDLFYREEFNGYTYVPCLSQPLGSEPPSHVLDVIHELDLNPKTHFYLCGSYEMIIDAHRVLRERNIDDSCIFTEEYYYK